MVKHFNAVVIMAGFAYPTIKFGLIYIEGELRELTNIGLKLGVLTEYCIVITCQGLKCFPQQVSAIAAGKFIERYGYSFMYRPVSSIFYGVIFHLVILILFVKKQIITVTRKSVINEVGL
ncbi:hypothetical protein [Candidatus Symbiopectobacterium sp. NZEC135]|uniref:hypothetical protein n=1 Tax=Candidatus Symbiopectobacterium sp. NZEC135 TaxID=2820471 RepID=UPI0022276FBB|nr:hypothetical protein [Candidatus Symbiopectobacterium sp. NZEC135]MCW2478859.1 hypothetical protein [Candidatus Symbiopectobacterium sp. NZEC135]